MQLRSIVQILDGIAPLQCAEAWDNVGLLLGDPNASVTRVLMAIDATPSVLDEAKRAGAELLVAYHPPVYKAVKRILPPSPLFVAAQTGIALFSPHTALDAAHGGTNDVLADAAGLDARTPLTAWTQSQTHLKLVFFVPAANEAAVLEALFAAGAGSIGGYTRCSFHTAGEGGFCPGANAAPAVGQIGLDNRVPELRVEVVLAKTRVGHVVSALFQSHPYETPAFDLLPLAPVPSTSGQGRIGDLPRASVCDAETLAARVAKAMNAGHAMVARPHATEATKPLKRVALQAGAGDSMLSEAVAQGADVFVTGELRHHTVLAALAQNVTVVTLTHDGSERAALAPFAKALMAQAPSVEVSLSTADCSPWSVP